MIWVYHNKSHHGNVMTALRFFHLSLCFSVRGGFFKKLLEGVIASIMAKFKQILWECFGNTLKRSFKNHKNSEIACYPLACCRLSDSGKTRKEKACAKLAGREKGKGKEREPVFISFTFELIRFRLSNCWNVNELESFSNFSWDYFAWH